MNGKSKGMAGIVLGILLFIPGLLWAHAFPDHSDPRVGSELKSPPAQVKIWFDSELEPLFSSIEVFDANHKKVDKGDGQVNPDDHTLLEVNLQQLTPGNYTVSWRVVAHDGHPTEGRFPFTVKGAP